ncbi:hypothetical protein SUDANB145_01936 [Streptomyces sp. enrichment culture]|uniref:hypothetical protein n=1 Tax=Streptomyces sp. enrichment culture TaxID=1795815 RepID=UPI003F57ECB7
MTSAGVEAAVRTMVTTALRGDPVTHLQPVVRHSQAPEPPKQRRPQSRVLPGAGSQLSGGQRALAGATGFLAWLTDPLHFLGELLLAPFRGLRWLCRGREKRRRNKRFAGGWDSTAGGLGTAMYIQGTRVLALGQRQVSLLYVGEHEAEVAWSTPREEVTGVEFADWDPYNEQRATLRWHFRDGSWYDVTARGAGWKQLPDALPSPSR